MPPTKPGRALSNTKFESFDCATSGKIRIFMKQKNEPVR